MVIIKSLMMDIFKGRNYAKLNQNSLQWAISFTANHDGTQIKVRSYIINDFASTNFKQVTSPVHLTPMGFQFDLTKRRREVNEILRQNALVFKEAKKQQRGESENADKIDKGITTDEIGRKYGTVHVSMGDTANLNIRKFQGLKASRDVPEDE